MANANTFTGGFIGNDFVLPSSRPKQIGVVEPTLEESVLQVPKTELVQATAGAAPALAVPKVRISSRFFSLRFAGLLITLLMSIYLAFVAFRVITHGSALSFINTATTGLTQTVSANIHHTPTVINLPANSVAVESKNLSVDLKNLESQPLSINFSFASVNPTPAQIAQWIKTSAGPKAGATVITVSTVAISNYLNSQVKLYDRSPVNQVVATAADGSTSTVITAGSNGVSYTGVSKVAQQFATALLKANGANITMQSTVVPYKTVQSTNLN